MRINLLKNGRNSMALAAEKSTLTEAERIVRDPGQFK